MKIPEIAKNLASIALLATQVGCFYSIHNYHGWIRNVEKGNDYVKASLYVAPINWTRGGYLTDIYFYEKEGYNQTEIINSLKEGTEVDVIVKETLIKNGSIVDSITYRDKEEIQQYSNEHLRLTRFGK